MPRDHFISDNLVNIRDHLRQNCSSVNAAGKQEVQEETPSGSEIHINLKKPVIQSASCGGRSVDREYNEFAGRLQHDLAAVSGELQQISRKREALEKFNAALLELSSALQKLPTENSPDFFREFDRLRIVYFQASGAVDGLQGSAETKQVHAVPEGRKAGHDWLLAAAVLLSAVIVAVTLILLFS